MKEKREEDKETDLKKSPDASTQESLGKVFLRGAESEETVPGNCKGDFCREGGGLNLARMYPSAN